MRASLNLGSTPRWELGSWHLWILCDSCYFSGFVTTFPSGAARRSRAEPQAPRFCRRRGTPTCCTKPSPHRAPSSASRRGWATGHQQNQEERANGFCRDGTRSFQATDGRCGKKPQTCSNLTQLKIDLRWFTNFQTQQSIFKRWHLLPHRPQPGSCLHSAGVMPTRAPDTDQPRGADTSIVLHQIKFRKMRRENKSTIQLCYV